MPKWKPRVLFAKVVCANAPYVIAAALCVAGLLSALMISAFLPGLWALAGFTSVLLIAGLPVLGKWSSREFLLESKLGVREPEAPNGLSGRASVSKSLPARSGVVLGAVPDCG